LRRGGAVAGHSLLRIAHAHLATYEVRRSRTLAAVAA
jgi:hypothetical protein